MARTRKKRIRTKGCGGIREKIRKSEKGGSIKKYEAVYDGPEGPDGKRRQRSKTFSTREEAELFLHEIKVNKEKNCSKVEKTKITVSQAIERYIDTRYDVTAGTKSEYSGYLERYIAHSPIGDMRVQKLEESDVLSWLKGLQTATPAHRALSDKSTRDIYSVLKSSLKDCVERREISESPCERIKKPKNKSVRPMSLPNHEDLQQLLEYIRSTEYENYFLFSIFFGLREMENLGLVQDDIDFGKRILHLRYQLRKQRDSEIKVGETEHFKYLKDKEMRDIPFGSSIEALLRKQIEKEKCKKKALGKKWPGKDVLERGDLLFSDEFGNYLTHGTVYYHFKQCCKKAGMPDMSIHSMRKIYTMLALEQGDPVAAVQSHLGHATPDFTLRTYAYITSETERRCANNMDNTMNSLVK